MSQKLIISNSLEEIYSLPQTVASETHICSFQYRVLNYIMYTSSSFFKIDLSLNDKCTFSGSSKEELYHLFSECSHAQIFWKIFSSWWLELVKEKITVSLKDIILGVLNRTDITIFLQFSENCVFGKVEKLAFTLILISFLRKQELSLKPRNIQQTKMRRLQVASFGKRWEEIIAKPLQELKYMYSLKKMLLKGKEKSCLRKVSVIFEVFVIVLYCIVSNGCSVINAPCDVSVVSNCKYCQLVVVF